MTDIVNQETRSQMMSRIRGKDTKPEMLIRSGLFRRGFRYRLHCSQLPGRPDLVLKKYRAVILVHGCFWHGHHCQLFKWPKTRPEFWKEKIGRTMVRDRNQMEMLQSAGWRCLVIWECSLKGRFRWSLEDLLDRVECWLSGSSQYLEISGTKPAKL